MRGLEAGNQCRRGAGGAIALADKLVSAPYQKLTPCLQKRTVSDFSGGAGTLDATVDRSGRLAESVLPICRSSAHLAYPSGSAGLYMLLFRYFGVYCTSYGRRESIDMFPFFRERSVRLTDIFVCCLQDPPDHSPR